MSRNYELDSLKSREQDVFQRKQAAFQHYAEARDRCNEAHDNMQSAWEERCYAREEMNREYEAMQGTSENYREVWDEYEKIRDQNNYEIEHLRAEADSEHQEMIDCFERASDCYENGDKSEAPYWAQQGHDHKDRRDNINEEVSRLCREVKEAKQNAEWRAPKTDSFAFHRAKDAFEQAKSRHEFAQAEFKRLKAERDRLKDIFDSLQAEHAHLKEEFQRKLEEVKTTNRRERDRTLDRAGVHWSERDDAKIVKKADGTTQIYHGGIGKGDGFGHGHTALDQFGNKTYDRDAFAEHGNQNYVDAKYGTFDRKPAKVYPDKRTGHDGWQNILYSSKGTFNPGENHGHILINEADSVINWRDEDQRHGDEYFIDGSKMIILESNLF